MPRKLPPSSPRKDDASRSDEDESAPTRRVSRRSGVKRPELYPADFDDGRIDADAEKVVRRLTRHGHEAYLVGGCVRDLLLGHKPKDFDVATSARTEDVRALFRNSRIIGRRFRLVHVLFSAGKVIETATFRRDPDQRSAGALIRFDNAFGEAHEDARRRDFTINALFYDVERSQVLDWTGGMRDIERRTVRTIGEPDVRFREDPVRILRAIKFAARLDIGLHPSVYDAAVQCRGALAMAARPRLFEELLRLLRGGASHRSFWLAWEMGVLDVLLPELSAYLSDDEAAARIVWRTFSAIDRETKSRGAPLDDIVLCTALLLEPMLEACDGDADRVSAAYDFLEPVVDRLNVPRRIAEAVRRIAAMAPRLEAGRAGRFARTELYPLAMQALELRAEAGATPTLPAPTPKKKAKAKAKKKRAKSDAAPTKGTDRI